MRSYIYSNQKLFIKKLFLIAVMLIATACIIMLGTSKAANAASAAGQGSLRNKHKEPAVTLTYDGETVKYNGVKGRLFYNHKTVELSTMPIVKADGILYAPAQELLETVFGYTWSYDEATFTYSAQDNDASILVSFKLNDYSFTVIKNGEEIPVKLNNQIMLIGYNGAEPVLCIPVKKLIEALGYTYSWDSAQELMNVQKYDFFTWTGETVPPDGTTNHINSAVGKYEIYDNMAVLDFHFYGDLQDSFDKVTVNRQDSIITVKLTQSTFLPATKAYDRFGEIVDRLEVSESDGTVNLIFTCATTTEFTYTQANNDLHLRLYWDYSTETGKTTNYSLTLKRPDGYFIDMVSNEDCYDSVKYTKAFKIIIKGDHVDYYHENPVIINSNAVKKLNIYLSDGGNTVIKVTTKSLQGYRIERQGDYFVVLMNKPKKIYKNIIVLDAGHGDHDNGASHYGYFEKNLNLKMIYTLMKPYFNQNDPEVKVYWTRKNDKFVTLDDRSKFAAKVGADAFVSLHMNSAYNVKANGTEVYYSTDNNKTGFGGIRSSDMAEMMYDELIYELDMEERGVKTAGFYVIKRNSVPAILIELGFLSGNRDHLKITKPEFQKKATETMANVIKEYFTEYPTGR